MVDVAISITVTIYVRHFSWTGIRWPLQFIIQTLARLQVRIIQFHQDLIL